MLGRKLPEKKNMIFLSGLQNITFLWYWALGLEKLYINTHSYFFIVCYSIFAKCQVHNVTLYINEICLR